MSARYIVQACHAAGCGDSAPLHPVDVLDQGPGHFKSLFPDDVDWFGRAVAMSADGSVLAIGVPNENSGKDQPDGSLRFRWVKAPTSAELTQLTQTLARRIGR